MQGDVELRDDGSSLDEFKVSAKGHQKSDQRTVAFPIANNELKEANVINDRRSVTCRSKGLLLFVRVWNAT
jgi:hypothetical protein